MTVTADAQSTPSTLTMSQLRRLFFRDCLRFDAWHAASLIFFGTMFVFVSPILGATPDSVEVLVKQGWAIGCLGLLFSTLMTSLHDGYLASVHPALPIPPVGRVAQ